MLKQICVLLALAVVVNCHMTGLCVSRVSDGRLQVAIEHWHGSAAIRAGATYTVSQIGGPSVTGPWQAPLACGCPALGCGTSYHDCGPGCTGSGVWYAIVNDPGFSYPGNIVVTASGGGSVTDRCGSCTGNGVSTSATIALPPPASTCFADICGDGIISGAEVCEVAAPCPPGYPSSFCGSCCITGTPCCNTGVALCRSATVSLDNSGQATVSFADVDNGSTLSPDCPQAGYPTISPTALTCANYPSVSVQLDVGPAGGVERCFATVTVQDPIPPSISCPGSVAVNTAPNQCFATVSYTTPVGTDQCPGASTTQTSGLASGSNFPVGSTTNAFTVTDQASLTDSCSFGVTVFDFEDPSITCPSDITVNNDAGQCGATVTYATPVGTDACPGTTTSLTGGLASGSFFSIGTMTQTFVATDAAGNTASCSFTVTVVDATSPSIDGSNGSTACPSTITRNAEPGLCSATVTYTTPMGTDQCPGATTTQTAGGSSGSAFNVGTTTNTFVVTDANGNTAQCSFNVVVLDGQAPEIDGTQGSTPCPSPITANTDANSCDAVVNYVAPIGTDNCPGSTTSLTAGLGSGGAFPAGATTTETYVVTDAAGLTDTCSFTVTINDGEAPVIDGSNGSTPCPAAMNVNTDAGVCNAVVTYTTPAGTDACGATTTQSAGIASGGTFPLGTTTNTFDATDSAGNTVSCSFTVTVVDNEDPVIDGSLGSTPCPAPIAVSNDPGDCGALITYTAAVGADACSGATTALTSGLGSGSFFPVGVTTETYTVTDAVGRTASCSFTVSVVDNEPPTLNASDGSTPCMAPFVVSNDPGLCSAVVNYPVPAGIDNCGSLTPTLQSGRGSGATFPAEVTTTETYTVTDPSGNSVTCSFDVVVEDNEAPVITHSPAGLVEVFPGEPYGYAITMTDNCAIDTHTHISGPMPTDSSTTPTDPQQVEYHGLDAAGNTVQYQFMVQTILIAEGVPSPTYMYLPMELDIAGAAFPSDTHITYQLRPIGGGQAAFESARAELASRVEFEGASQVLPGRWEFWMVGWPSSTARYSQEFILCASDHFCY